MSVWTSHDDIRHVPLAGDWLDASWRRLARFAISARMPLAMTGGLLAALLVLLIFLPDPTPRPPAVKGDIGAAAWTRQSVNARLALRSSSLTGLSQASTLWLRQRGEDRETEDRLTVGEIEGASPYLLTVASRPGAAAAETSLFTASARMAANAGLTISRFARTGDHVGRFGATETARVSLSRVFPSGPSRESCIAWRAGVAGPDLGLGGVVCPAQGQSIDETKVECLLRDLTALPAADGVLRQLLSVSPAMSNCGSMLTAGAVRPNRKP